MTEEEALAMIRAGGVASNLMEVNADEVNKLFGDAGLNGGMVQLTQEEALKLMGSVDRMDVGVMDSEEEQEELVGQAFGQTNQTLSSLTLWALHLPSPQY